MEGQNTRALIRNFLLELIVYGILVVGYFFIVLRLLAEPLADLFHSNLVTYAFIALGLIVAQGVVLDAITSFLLEQLRLEQPE
ncbi:MAG: hypothetical protein ACE5LU_09680 [Anaerolineae bacterium]